MPLTSLVVEEIFERNPIKLIFELGSSNFADFEVMRSTRIEIAMAILQNYHGYRNSSSLISWSCILPIRGTMRIFIEYSSAYKHGVQFHLRIQWYDQSKVLGQFTDRILPIGQNEENLQSIQIDLIPPKTRQLNTNRFEELQPKQSQA